MALSLVAADPVWEEWASASEGWMFVEGGVEGGEGLDGDDDDAGLGSEGFGELFGFAFVGFLAVNRLDYAVGVVELVDCFLKLAVEDGTIGDDDH